MVGSGGYAAKIAGIVDRYKTGWGAITGNDQYGSSRGSR